MSRTAVNAYWEIFRLKLHEFTAYPIVLIGEWLSFPLVMGIFYVVYGTLYETNPSFAGTPFLTLIVYLGLAHAFTKMGDAIGIGYEINQEISKGEIFMYVTRPISYFGVWLSKQAGRYVAMGVVMIPLLYILAGWLGHPLAPERYIAAVAVATFGGIVLFQLQYIVGLISFWLEEAWGIRWALSTISYFFSGATIPIALFPQTLQTISHFLPFLHQAGIPAQFALGQVGIETLGQSAFVILVWIVFLSFVQAWTWKQGLLKHDGKG